MISFRQFIAEVFDKPLPYTHDNRFPDSSYQHYSFNVGEDKIRVNIQNSTYKDEYANNWMITFDRNDRYSMTNDNKYQIQIMSTIVDIMNHHFKNIKLDEKSRISFTSDENEKGRTVLYRRLAKLMASKLNGRVEETRGMFKGQIRFNIIK